MGVKYLYGIDVTGQSTFSTNVGIGTLSPNANLDIAGGVVILGQNKIDGSSDNLKIMSDFANISGSSTIEFSVDNSEKMRITNGGNVGIGTTAPAYNLDVVGTGGFTNSGSSNTLTLSHSSGSGIALNISKGGNGEGLYVNKTSGTGNAVTVIGTLNATTLVKNGGTSTQYLMADGSVSTLTNPVTGTGTTNYLPKWTSGSAIGNSIVTEDGGNTLRIIAASAAVRLDGSRDYLLQTVDTDGRFRIYDQTAALERITLTSAGNVGIGTTAPVFSAGSGLQIVRSDYANVRLTGGASVGLDLLQSSDGTGYLRNRDNAQLRLGTNNVDVITLTSTGNVGIGTTTPLRKLHVAGEVAINASGSQYYGVYINGAGEGANPNILIGDWHNSSANFTWDSVGNYLRIDAQNSTIGAPIVFSGNDGVLEYARFTATGSLGIGTTAPGSQLQVGVGTSNQPSPVASLGGALSGILSTLSLVNTLGNAVAGYGTALDFHVNSGYSPTGRIATIAESTGTPTALAFYTYNDGLNEKLRITSAGNVGIGTDVPLATASNRTSVTINGTNTSILTLSSGKVLKGYLYNDGTNIDLYSVNSTVFTAGGGEKMRLNASGNLGIGTTSPGFKLDVVGTVRASTYLVTPLVYSGGGNIVFGNVAQFNDFVGIGTASPAEKLHVVGNIRVTNANLSNQENLDVDTGTEVIAIAPIALYTAAFFDFVVKNGANVRSGTVYACHDGTSVEYTETSTADLGNTSAVVFTVDISAGNMRLLATTTTDNWSIKTLTRTI